MMMRKGLISKNPVIFVLLLITICSILVLFISILKLPDITPNNTALSSSSSSNHEKIGKFGEKIIGMLPKDLGFTLFLPTEKAFERDLKLHWNESSSSNSLVGDDDDDDSYAILSRVMGFSAVPRMIYSDDLMYDKEIDYDSLSGYVLYISKDSSDRGLVINGVRSEEVDLKIGNKIVVHLMNGVVMDSEFQQSFKSDDDETDQE